MVPRTHTYGRLIVFLLSLAAATVYAEPMPLSTLLSETGAHLQWDSYRNIGVIWKGETLLSFTPGARDMVLNYQEKVDAGPIERKSGALIASEDAASYIRSIFAPPKRPEEGRYISTICLDPGHGGKDPGTIGRQLIDGEVEELQEKDVVLEVGKRLQTMLAAKYPNRNIVLSRKNDTYVSLEQRTEIANDLPAGKNDTVVFVSIHANASLNRNARGFEVWYLPPDYRREGLVDSRSTGVKDPDVLSILNTMREEEFTIESVLLAKSILSGIDNQVGDVSPSRGIKKESWYVVRKAKMPSVLIEIGFVTNASEMLRLKDASYLNNLAKGIYNGITSFVSDFENYNQGR